MKQLLVLAFAFVTFNSAFAHNLAQFNGKYHVFSGDNCQGSNGDRVYVRTNVHGISADFYGDNASSIGIPANNSQTETDAGHCKYVTTNKVTSSANQVSFVQTITCNGKFSSSRQIIFTKTREGMNIDESTRNGHRNNVYRQICELRK